MHIKERLLEIYNLYIKFKHLSKDNIERQKVKQGFRSYKNLTLIYYYKANKYLIKIS